MTDAITQATVSNRGTEPYAVTIDVSGHELHGDEPFSFGGKDAGPAPYDFLTAALGECMAITVRWFAKQQGWPLERVEVTITHHKEALEGNAKKSDIFETHVVVHGDALSEEQRQKLLEIATKCPVHRTLEGTPVFKEV